jgi:ubiquinone/menaquinone biosynthesis C-methylase UbiE
MDDILKQQIQYYQARAAEYDQWFYRQGRYDWGEAANQRWFDQAEIVRRVLHDVGPAEHALELACGTGIWTQELVKLAQRVTALDASPEMIAINRAKVASPRVTYREADLFTWQPDEQYDLLFFGFWLSHVPPDRLDAFLGKVHSALRPGGRFFFVDSRLELTSSAHDHPTPNADDLVQTRKLNDGREFRVVKVFYDPAALGKKLAALGFEAAVTATETYFLYGTGQKAG